MEAPKYRAYSLNNFEKIPQVAERLSENEKEVIRVVGTVLPFKVNNYVVDELINWDNIPDDPIYQLTFPQRGMLSDEHYNKMKSALDAGLKKPELTKVANEIRLDLNPHPAGQMEKNVPEIDGVRLTGVQHKYDQTVLFFPSNSQTCHAYCTFCFRWPQFVGLDEMKFAMRETDLLVKYLKAHPEVTDVLFTGGDPMIMKSKQLRKYLEPLINGDVPNLKTIRIGTKALTYWPYKFTTDKDAEEILELFKEVTDSGIHLAFMAHFNNPAELRTPAVKEAIRRVRSTGAQIRTQAPVMRYINDDAQTWKEMWEEQVSLGCIPYYMFVARDTGAQDYFAVPLFETYKIFREAYQQVSGVARTVRGPSMSADPGKVHILGVDDVAGEKVFMLNMIQGRDANWVGQPFFARFDPEAIWLDDLKPAFSDRFFFEQPVEEPVIDN